MATAKDNLIDTWTNHMNRQFIDKETWTMPEYLFKQWTAKGLHFTSNRGKQMKILMKLNSYLSDRQKLELNNTKHE